MILTEEISRKIKYQSFPQWGWIQSCKKKKSSLSEYSYFHACCSHYFKHSFYKFANTVFIWQIKTLYRCAHIAPPPHICHWFYILNWKTIKAFIMSGWGWEKRSIASGGCDVSSVCVQIGGQLLRRERSNLNVHASRLARCKIILVLCVLAIGCRSLCTLLDCL